MKLQYLGDSKDCFKWDYHDFLVSRLEYSLFNIVLMRTPDDGGNDGNTHPSQFPARMPVIHFCEQLRIDRSFDSIMALPRKTGASYKIELHKKDMYISNSNRSEYFSALKTGNRQLLLLDPDNGFEPEKSITEKHVSYKDISSILDQLPEKTVVSVFQHHRRKSFGDDFARIKERIESGFSTAIYWHSLMFVSISRSEQAIQRVIAWNREYSTTNPVKALT